MRNFGDMEVKLASAQVTHVTEALSNISTSDTAASRHKITSKPSTDSRTNDEEITIVTTGTRRPRKSKQIEDDEPLIDNTIALPKKSKKTERISKRLKQKQQKVANRPAATSILDLPPELVEQICTFLRPSDVLNLQAVNRGFNFFVQQNANSLAREIILYRYWVLSRCFPLPTPFKKVDDSAHAALLNPRRQEMIQIHRKPYQHVKSVDEHKVCTCLTCILAWNNLCLILDLAHWQPLLDRREPIPMIPRGTKPEWNQTLLDAHATVVEKAMNGDPLCYAMILEKHLRSITSTLLRSYRGKKTVHPNRLYHITRADADTGNDEFLERSGPPSYEFPYHRDNYYNISAYVPNRKWSKERQCWLYYSSNDMHERDLQWLKDRFPPAPSLTSSGL